MAKPSFIELSDGPPIPILYEDRSILAIDKPPGWMLVPFSWQRTSRNLQAALVSSIAAGDFWARSRNLKFLRYVHRLDAETSGVLLFAKSHGAAEGYSQLFESRRMEKVYLAVVEGVPRVSEWTSTEPLGQVPGQPGRMRGDARLGKEALTRFKVLMSKGVQTLVEARPETGRTHQIRVHLACAGHPVARDYLYGKPRTEREESIGLRAIELRYQDPFTRRPVSIRAPTEGFLREYGFDLPAGYGKV
jgi:23S rRNA pseudouridine1911/1915/1917 synthase